MVNDPSNRPRHEVRALRRPLISAGRSALRPGILIALLAALPLLGGCLEGGVVEIGGPLEITLAVTQAERIVGLEHEFRLQARGRQLLGVILDYGDGRVDSIQAFGAQTISHGETHTYEAVGSYTVRAVVEEAGGALARDSLLVTVVAP